jgi:predicted nucleotidyltransferase
MNELNEHISQINQLCNLHKVKSLFTFGSVVTNQFNISSDIYMVVDIESNDPFDYSENYFAVKFQLEDIFHRQIDLLEERAIKNPLLKKEIDNTKVLIYGR